jgi:hypothetical protein
LVIIVELRNQVCSRKNGSPDYAYLYTVDPNNKSEHKKCPYAGGGIGAKNERKEGSASGPPLLFMN